jgi:phosphatidylinositol 4-phosphatase
LHIFKYLLLTLLQVNWPKLNTPTAAIEGYQDALIHARGDQIIGQWLPGQKHQRGYSSARLGYLEEGKKRIE